MAIKAASKMIPRLEQASTAIFLCDVQERFATAIDSFDHMVNASSKLLRGAGILQIPVFATEQAPKGMNQSIWPLCSQTHCNNSSRAYCGIPQAGCPCGNTILPQVEI